jgi:hypothetical protein
MQTLLEFLILSASLVIAKPFQPAPTNVLTGELHHEQGWSARPTPPPSLELVRRRLGELDALHKRAAGSITSGEFLGFFAPDNTCGYDGGQLGMLTTGLMSYY